jgi:hypothetical protein
MTVTLPPLNIWQKDLVDDYRSSSKGRWFVVKSPRQVGKSVVLEYLLILASLQEPYSISFAISPVFSQARKLWQEITLTAKPIIKSSNGSMLSIEFINGSQIYFKSSEQGDNVRGFTTKHSGILCIDEAAFINSDFFYNVCVPITNVYQSPIFLFSTPKYKQGLFYELFMDGLSGTSNVTSHDWARYDLSKFLPDSVLKMYKSKLPKLTYQAEYLAEFIDGDGTVFSNYKECVGPTQWDLDEPLYLAVDWGTGSGKDDTAITVGQNVNGVSHIHRLYYFNDKRTQETIEYISNLIHYFKSKGFKDISIIVEKNSIGNVFYDLLRDAIEEIEIQHNNSVNWRDEISLTLKTFNTTNKSKKRIVEQLITLFEQNNIIIPDDTKLLTQLSMFEAKVNNLGTVQYAGANGSHDDLVMSLCILISALWNIVE